MSSEVLARAVTFYEADSFDVEIHDKYLLYIASSSTH